MNVSIPTGTLISHMRHWRGLLSKVFTDRVCCAMHEYRTFDRCVAAMGQSNKNGWGRYCGARRHCNREAAPSEAWSLEAQHAAHKA